MFFTPRATLIHRAPGFRCQLRACDSGLEPARRRYISGHDSRHLDRCAPARFRQREAAGGCDPRGRILRVDRLPQRL